MEGRSVSAAQRSARERHVMAPRVLQWELGGIEGYRTNARKLAQNEQNPQNFLSKTSMIAQNFCSQARRRNFAGATHIVERCSVTVRVPAWRGGPSRPPNNLCSRDMCDDTRTATRWRLREPTGSQSPRTCAKLHALSMTILTVRENEVG